MNDDLDNPARIDQMKPKPTRHTPESKDSHDTWI
jgi:hypothetical protein